MKKLIFLFCWSCLFITSTLWAAGLSGIIIAGGGGTISSVPVAPTGVSATAGNAQNTVSFTASSGSTSCNLYWKSGSSMSGNCTGNGTKVSGVTSPDVIGSLTNGMAYYYMLTCQNSAGESSCSSEVNATPTGVTAPGPPTSVAAVAGNTLITMSWSAPSSGGTVSQYNMGCANASNTETFATFANITSPANVTSLTNGTPYYCKVQAQNSAGTANSSEVTATPAVPSPSFQFGLNNATGASSLASGDGTCSLYSAPANATISYIKVYSISGGHVKVALYSASSVLLASQNTSTSVTSGTWNQVNFSTPYAVTASTSYYLCVAEDSNGAAAFLLTGGPGLYFTSPGITYSTYTWPSNISIYEFNVNYGMLLGAWGD